jgi:Rrf2 family protein
MKVSQKGLYALQALILLADRYDERNAVKIHDIAAADQLPEKFLELILLELKRARIVESVRGAKGGYRLRRKPSEIFLGEIIRTIGSLRGCRISSASCGGGLQAPSPFPGSVSGPECCRWYFGSHVTC